MDILNFFTSNSDRNWKPFLRSAVITMVLLIVGHFILLLVVDPYDTVPFSPNIDRVPVDDIQRIFHPLVAKKPQFDSAIIGNSTIRLLKPERLNQGLNAHFANLGMNAATAWEQEQILRVFLRHRTTVDTVIIGMDQLWCRQGTTSIQFGDDDRRQQFHEWIYDEETINNIPPINLATVKHSWLQLFALAGAYTPEYGVDGYTVFTKPMSKYSLNRARRHIYRSQTPKQHKPVKPAVVLTDKERESLQFYEIDQRMKSLLELLPEETRKVFMYVPLHAYQQPIPGSRKDAIWAECKQRMTTLAAGYSNSFVIDFLFPSKLTRTDENYWDYQHYTVDVAERLAHYLDEAINTGTVHPEYRILHRPESL